MNVPKQKLRRLAKKYHLKLLLLFGSAAMGKTHPKSDLDFAFFSNTIINEEKLHQDLMDIFHREDIDLINILTTHDPLLRFEILHKGISLYESEVGLKSTMEWQSYFDYIDFQKYYTMRSSLLTKRIAAL